MIIFDTFALRKPFMSSYRFPTFVEHPVTVIQQVQIDMLGLVECTLQNACIPFHEFLTTTYKFLKQIRQVADSLGCHLLLDG